MRLSEMKKLVEQLSAGGAPATPQIADFGGNPYQARAGYPVRFYKDRNRVYLDGRVYRTGASAASDNEEMFQLPEVYCPPHTIWVNPIIRDPGGSGNGFLHDATLFIDTFGSVFMNGVAGVVGLVT
jgi:hypothetical protein